MKSVLTSVRLKAEISSELKKRAKKDGVSVSELINCACRHYLRNIGMHELKPITVMIPKKKRIDT